MLTTFYNKSLYITFLFVLCISFNTFAQEGNYWSQSFNRNPSLLGGAVVGGNAGETAIYYNPSLIDKERDKELSISVNLFSLQFLKLINLAGENTEISKIRPELKPRFVAFTLIPKKSDRFVVEFAYLSPIKVKRTFDFVYKNTLDLIKRLDGDETHLAGISYERRYIDLYLGTGFSYKLSDRFKFGVSGFFSLKRLNYLYRNSIRAFQGTDTVFSNGVPEEFYNAESILSENFSYNFVSFILKAGFSYASLDKRFGLGLNFTIPTFPLYKSADVFKDYTRSNIFDDSSNTFTRDIVFTGYQESVEVNIKSPYSIAFGFMYRSKNKKQTSIYFSTEYFFEIPEYELLKPNDTPIDGNVEVDDVTTVMNYKTSNRQIINFGLGLEQFISEKVTLAVGFKTDFSRLPKNKNTEISQITTNNSLINVSQNLYHFSIGANASLKKVELTLGLQYSLGRKRQLFNLVNLTDPVEYNPDTQLVLQGTREPNMDVKFNEISIFIGFSYTFGKEKE